MRERDEDEALLAEVSGGPFCIIAHIGDNVNRHLSNFLKDRFPSLFRFASAHRLQPCRTMLSPTVILSASRGSNATKGKSNDPDIPSSAIPLQGVLSKFFEQLCGDLACCSPPSTRNRA